MYKIVDENGKDVLNEVYTKETAERIWDEYNGIMEDIDGNEYHIYITEAEK